MGKDHCDQIYREKSSVILKMYLLLGFAAVVILSSMCYILFMGKHLTEVNTPLVDAAMEIKLEATQAHLWFEEIISGDRNESIESVYELIDSSRWYANAMLEGGENQEGRFIVLKDAHLRGQIELVRDKIDDFREMTQKRWDMKDTSGTGSEIDQKYDAIFRDFMKLSDDVETELQGFLKAEYKKFRIVQSSLIVVCCIVFILVGLTLRSLFIAQIMDEIKLSSLNQQLDASNQQLLAANQQLDASNQQLGAANQQLDASNQQLRALNQQLDAANQQLKANEEALRSSEKFLIETNQTAMVGGWEYDLDTYELRMTREINRIYEIPLDYKPTLEEAFSFIHPEDRPLLEDAINRSVELGEPYDIEFRIITANGVEKWANGRGIPEVKDGKAVKMRGTFQDITDRKRYEFERDELIRALASKNDELQSIVYISSHDLRSPLVNINGFSGSLAESCEVISRFIDGIDIDEKLKKEILPVINEEIPESLSFIKSSTERMSKLIDGLLRVSRIGTCDVDFQKIDMNRVVSRISDNLKFKSDRIGAEVVYGDLPVCTGDEDQVTQLFSNLIDNAVKYLEPTRKGSVNISGESKDGRNYYYIEDNGIGIAEAHLNKIFGIYHRLNPSGPVEGEGLGLTIVRRIVDRHNGDIKVESTEGVGTKFTVVLPD